MSELPAYVEWMDVVRVCTVAFLLCAAGDYLSRVARFAYRARRGR